MWKKSLMSLFGMFGMVFMLSSCNINGAPGATGPQGPQGTDGTNGTDGKDGTGGVSDCHVGAVGPTGGYVFFCDDPGNPVLSDGKIGLEAAPVGTETTLPWDASLGEFTQTNTIATAIGAGQANTAAIVSALSGEDESTYAAGYCATLIVETYDGFFLPSKGELNRMYLMFQDYGVGGFAYNKLYWSSSEGEGESFAAWLQYFGLGLQDYYNKDFRNRVRCVRAF